MPYSDINLQRKAQREFLQKKKIENPKWHKELKKRQKQKKENIKDIVNYIKKSVGCLICNEHDHNKLQFHHVIPNQKIATIAQLISNRAKLITVLREIDKCVCVCIACHKELGSSLNYVLNTIKNEKWYNDWGIHEALDWFNSHPQMRNKNCDFLEIIKAVARNTQIQDPKNFKKTLI